VSAATIARPTTSVDAHFYDPVTGEPRHWIQKKTGKPGEMRKTTIADARKNNWVAGVTTVLKAADKPALTKWMIEQAVLSVLTAPRRDGEDLDAFIQRVLHDEKQQDAEAQAARDLGTRIHDALEKVATSLPIAPDLEPFTGRTIQKLTELGRVVEVEKIIIGAGYGGKLDCLVEGHDLWVIDFKTTKTLPIKGAWPEHQMQLGAYAAALGNTGDKRVRCANIYVSTTAPGEIAFWEVEKWQEAFIEGFLPLFRFWQWMNDYKIA
jgi:hypothetical protein